jgi:hypothetical protein
MRLLVKAMFYVSVPIRRQLKGSFSCSRRDEIID